MQSLKSDYVNVCPLTRLLPRPINDFDPIVRRGEHVQDEVIRGYVEDDQDEECLEELEYQVVVVGEDEGPDSEVQDRIFVFTSTNKHRYQRNQVWFHTAEDGGGNMSELWIQSAQLPSYHEDSTGDMFDATTACYQTTSSLYFGRKPTDAKEGMVDHGVTI
ncbi:uncharacterized protein EV420DRAFT_1651845 [Desarmillaria tabescens]|uniref:Uncharacterized protein n=1 Tax=Armillaria tabescens TaxID=1929756 RepID=A0AA39JBD7_ARMTA|nr:uncharacterized protein EV420DRAFT_1651845 [Desarmillaria tabescens]KAK0437593.1 hypothetical protein EV420DRAFT_1651845 [Desarmillaria tabescens]